MSALAEQWANEGYVVIRDLLATERVAALRPLCDDILERWRVRDPQTGQPSPPDSIVMRHLNHPSYFRDRPEQLETLMAAVADVGVLGVVRELLQDQPLFRCTSYFMNPLTESRDGNWHRDSQFYLPDPAEERRQLFEDPTSTWRQPGAEGVQLQIALARSSDTEFVPGSHRRWDTDEELRIRSHDSLSNHMPGALRIHLEPGDAAIFNSLGLHRGRYHTDKLRRTLMFTYTTLSHPTFDSFIEQPWFLESDYLSRLTPTTRAFFDSFIATFHEHWLKKTGLPTVGGASTRG